MEFKFKAGDEVIFVDDPKGTSLSLNGRKGKIKDPFVMRMNNENLFGVQWNNKEHEYDDAYSNVNERCLRLYDENIPELYAIHIAYICYSPYERCNFSSEELAKLAKARDDGLLNDILGVDT